MDNKTNIVIIEDELPNVRMLKGMIRLLRPNWEIVAVLESVKSSTEWFNTNPHPQLIFMDIQLTDGLSFSIFEQLSLKSLIIFTTAYNEYAIQAFKVNSIDYLLKPIKQQDLTTAIEKFERAQEIIDSGETKVNTPDYSELISILQKGEKKYKTRFLISGVQDYFKIDTHDIAYFYTQNRACYLVTFSGKEHIVDFTMEKLEELLNPEQFFRANRSHIVSIDAVRKFENYFGGKLLVKLIQPFTLRVEVSRLKASDFKDWMDA